MKQVHGQASRDTQSLIAEWQLQPIISRVKQNLKRFTLDLLSSTMRLNAKEIYAND